MIFIVVSNVLTIRKSVIFPITKVESDGLSSISQDSHFSLPQLIVKIIKEKTQMVRYVIIFFISMFFLKCKTYEFFFILCWIVFYVFLHIFVNRNRHESHFNYLLVTNCERVFPSFFLCYYCRLISFNSIIRLSCKRYFWF